MKRQNGKRSQITDGSNVKQSRFWQKSTFFLVKIATLTAIASVIFLFLDFHIFPPPFHMFKFDLAEVPVLLGAFSLGPLAAVLMEVIKVVIGILFTGLSWGGVGDLSNLFVNVSFVLPAAIYYYYHRTKKGAIIAMILGNLSLYLVSCLSNYFIMLPLAGMVEDPLRSTTVWVGLGFNAIKGVSNCLITFLLYKRLSSILKMESLPPRKPIFGTHKVKGLFGTARLAKRMSAVLKGGEVIVLCGDLGAGKTTFTQYLFRALGVRDTVTSPTFTIMKQYRGTKFRLYHFDLYRIENPNELSELGFDEYLGEKNSVSVIEWNKIENISAKIYNVTVTRAGNKGRVFGIADGTARKTSNAGSSESLSNGGFADVEQPALENRETESESSETVREIISENSEYLAQSVSENSQKKPDSALSEKAGRTVKKD